MKQIQSALKYKESKNQLSQILGYQFQDGTQMSIGQWQKLSLGRALYREAELYIFDEPNASLDLRTESAILDTIKSETKKKISIIIMHRFNYMVRCADKIVVLKNGEITEMGTHEQLVEKKGLYNDLYYMHLEINSKDKVYDMG